VAIANAVIVKPTLPLALCIAALSALLIAAGVVALLIAFRGVAALPISVAYVVPNGAVVLLQPLILDSTSLPVLVTQIATGGTRLSSAMAPRRRFDRRAAVKGTHDRRVGSAVSAPNR
jgi:hypothetical protein